MYFEERISPWIGQGTAGQLYELLNNQIIPDRSTWPKSPKGLADQLRRIAPAYRAKGIEISHLGHSREGALWRISPIRSSTATPPGVEGGIRYGAHRE
jgi:transposase InsO family protein